MPVMSDPFSAKTGRVWTVYRYPVLDSTQDEAVRLLDAGHSPPLAVQATCQTKGRGQWDRQWHSPAGHLYGSAVFSPGCCSVEDWPAEAGGAALAAGQAVCEALQASGPAGAGASLRHPNDVMIGGLKVAGILCEFHTAPRGRFLVVGTGVNLGPLEEGHPSTATSLCLHGVHCTPEALMEKLLPLLHGHLARWCAERIP
jgi:BirA family biotin operon repressor/biotin-[acetyl-CoA-carboxylase] ligase